MTSRVFVSGLFTAGIAAGLLGGCVYYNGVYNANRLARSARKAEREGRTFEANNLWGQVATKAESVAVRHPTSKYAEMADVLRGVALARLGQCDQALGPLGHAIAKSISKDLAEEALLAAGHCHVALGNLAAGDLAFSELLASKNTDRRREARFQHARLLRQAGRYDEALSALGNDREPRAESERILALAGTGRRPEALALADSLIGKRDSANRWDSVIVALGERDAVAASRLVERTRGLPGHTPETRARLLLEDGLRLTRTDTSLAAQRLREAVVAGGTGDAARRASLTLVRLDLSRASRPEDLPGITEALQGLEDRFEAGSDEMRRLGTVVGGVHTTAISVTAGTPQGDLRLFLAAESARDSLAAPGLARSLFRRIPDEWPASTYAPKAILAAQQLDSSWADSARALLEEHYLDSPYLAMVRGDATEAYRQLEDSLGAFAASLSGPLPQGVRRPPAGRDDDDRPKRRPGPPPGASRVPEP